MKFLVIILIAISSNCKSARTTEETATNDQNDLQGVFTVISINDKKVETEKPLTIVFNRDDKTVLGYAGCNTYGCSYLLGDKSVLSFGMIRATRMYCENTMEIESDMMQALAKVKNYKLVDNVLTLRQGDLILLKAKATK